VKTIGTDEQELAWKINSVREEISLDWKNLATKNLTADQRTPADDQSENITEATLN
jgi:hypothetical protein